MGGEEFSVYQAIYKKALIIIINNIANYIAKKNIFQNSKFISFLKWGRMSNPERLEQKKIP